MAHLFVDDLTVIDCSLLDAERGLIGASWIVDLELIGELDDQSMIFDFGHVKKDIKRLIDDLVDHKLVIPTQYSQLSVDQSQAESNRITFNSQSGNTIEHLSPSTAICLIDSQSISRNSVTQFLVEKIKPLLPANVEDIKLNLRQEDDYAFYYCYSHGLKKHDGNCQRIAHGHRSRIQIFENGERSRTWESRWSEMWKDIYIGTREDVSKDSDGRVRFSYDAPQGHFELELDKQNVYLMDNDTTVECIADHIASELKRKHPTSDIRVKAFEGVGKGAIGER